MMKQPFKKNRKPKAQEQKQKPFVPSALPPSPVSASLARTRYVVIAVFVSAAFALSFVGGPALIRLMPASPAIAVVKPPLQKSVIVQPKNEILPKELENVNARAVIAEKDDEPLGINLSVASRATEVKEVDYSHKKKAEQTNEDASVSLEKESNPKALPKVKVKAEAKKIKHSPQKAPKIVEKKQEKPAEKKPSIQTKQPSENPLLAKAHAREDIKDWKGALAAYNEFLHKDKGNRDGLKGKAYVLSQIGSEDALDVLDDMIDDFPRMAFIHAARAKILSEKKDLLEALYAWQKATRFEPENSDYLLSYAVVNDKLGNGKEALSLYRKLPKPWSADVKKRITFLSKG